MSYETKKEICMDLIKVVGIGIGGLLVAFVLF